jgi:hypothetical protein
MKRLILGRFKLVDLDGIAGHLPLCVGRWRLPCIFRLQKGFLPALASCCSLEKLVVMSQKYFPLRLWAVLPENSGKQVIVRAVCVLLT